MTVGGAGALASAMLSAAVAARADPTRFGRGRTYVREGAVVDLTAAPGMLRASVVGSRPAPYRVSVAVPGTGAGLPRVGADDTIDVRRLNELVPRPDEMRCSCNCPDGPADPCKHAVAALLAFADQVAIRPELLAEWRSGPPAADGTAASRPGRSAAAAGRPGDGSKHAPSTGRADAEPAVPERTPEEAAFLGDPDEVITDLPELGPLPVGSARLGTVDLAAIVSDALDQIRATYGDSRRR